MQQQCTSALVRAKHIPHCAVLLCKTDLQQAVCDCIYTYGDVLFIQVCSDPAQMYCSSVEGKIQSPLLVLLCKTGSQRAVCHCSYTYGDLLFI